MSLISGALLSIIEKELVGQEPAIQTYVLQFLGSLSADVVDYVERKINPPVVSSAPTVTTGEE
jgi:hypothetical protein